MIDGIGVNIPIFVVTDRGYTGHEHLQTINLIHMNARLYDLLLGRFLAPNNYVQDPLGTQNFNRYGYAMNNPLVYTDPSGEFFEWTAITFVYDFFKTGFFKGGFDPTSSSSRNNAWRNFDPSAEWSMTNKAARIDWGSFRKEFTKWKYWQSGTTWFETFEELKHKLSQGEWLQSAIGKAFSQIQNLKGNVEKVGYFEDRIILRVRADAFDGYDGISLGHYILGENIAMNPDDLEHDRDLFAHEFSHSYQSRVAGPMYMFKYGVSSAIGNSAPENDADFRANRKFGFQPYNNAGSLNRIKWQEHLFGPDLFLLMWIWN